MRFAMTDGLSFDAFYPSPINPVLKGILPTKSSDKAALADPFLARGREAALLEVKELKYDNQFWEEIFLLPP